LQGMSSDSTEVRELLSVLRVKVSECREPLSAQAVGNALYGLQGMSSDSTEVRELLSVLRVKVSECLEPLSAQAVGNALYGLHGMNFEQEVESALLLLLLTHCESVLLAFSDGRSSSARGKEGGMGVDDELLDLWRSIVLFLHKKKGNLPPHLQEKCFLSKETIADILATDFSISTSTSTSSSLKMPIGSKIEAVYGDLIEQYYWQQSSTRLQSNVVNVVVERNQLLSGFEADIVLRFPSSSLSSSSSSSLSSLSCSGDNESSSNNSIDSFTTIVNIEIDGPKHKLGKKRRYCDARDSYLRETQGVLIERWDVTKYPQSMGRGKLKEKVKVLLDGLEVLLETMK
jgi:hypothetical protein